MDFLGRESAPFDGALWQRIDEDVVAAAKQMLTGRRFLPLYGPLGAGSASVVIDSLERDERFEDGLAFMQGRQLVQLPLLYEDFWLYWQDLEAAAAAGVPADTSAARMAAGKLAFREDAMVFYGVPALGVEGLATAKGATKQKLGDWAAGEGAFSAVAKAVETLLQAGRYGRHTLVVSSDLYGQLQRIQPGTGELESARIAALVEGRLLRSPSLKPKTALLLCAQPQYLDLAVGVDLRVAYTESVNLNHHLRVLETALPRVKAPDAIVLLQ